MTGTPSNRHATPPRTPENHTRVVPEGSGQENASERHLRNGLTGCPRCDWHGPDLPLTFTPTTGEARDWHRAWHDLARAAGIDRLVEALARHLAGQEPRP